MRYVVWLVAFICSCVAVLGAVPAQAEKRAALVIGNSAYQHTRALPNPKNDAEAIAKLLAEKGFDVTLNSDLDYRAMRDAVRAFASTAREADVALVYYAGHGIEIAGENYLVPIDAKLVRDSDLEYESVTLASVLSATANARRLRVVVLDACRNNPLGERIVLGSGVTRSVTRGLARIEPRGDMLVAYAARAGTLAQDGAGRHSPYADALLKHMGTPGLDVRLMFGKVRDQVLAATRQEQEPFIYGSLTGEVIALVPGKPATSAQQVELVFWSSVKDSNSAAVLATYLERYPNGEFAPVARALIEHYDRQNKLDLAVREGERKRQEEAIRAAEAKRLEDEQRAREAALAEGRKRAEEAKNIQEAKRLEAEVLARKEELRKALDDARTAREAAKAAEEKRVAALKAAEHATKAAEETIAKKQEKTSDPTKLAALPKIEKPEAVGSLDGVWTITWRREAHCGGMTGGGTYPVSIKQGTVAWKGGAVGRVSANGAAAWNVGAITDGAPTRYQGRLHGTTGSGSFARADGKCSGSFTARRN